MHKEKSTAIADYLRASVHLFVANSYGMNLQHFQEGGDLES